MTNSCENCGDEVDASYPKGPEVNGVMVCSKKCARELGPLPAGFGFVIADGGQA